MKISHGNTKGEIMSIKSGKPEQGLIGNLPDCIISLILSQLPTDDAVKTSVLSKDWEFKWTRMHKFVIGDKYIAKWKKEGTKFETDPNIASFVDRTLLLSQDLQEIRLNCCELNHIHRWMTAALNRNVRCLDIECPVEGSLVLPRNLLTCYSLRELRLHAFCTFKVSEEVCFPNLVALSLASVCISNEHSDSYRVEFKLPLLEKLQLEYCEWLNIKFVEIYSPKMTSLELTDPDSNDCTFKIIGDSLVKFKSYGDYGLTDIDLSGSVDRVVYVDLNHWFERADLLLLEKEGLQLRKLLRGFSNLKDLELGGDVAEAIAKSKRGLSLPIYYKLEQLVLRALVCAEVVLELLHAAPYLKHLIVDVEDLKEYDYDAVESVPSCMVSHLEKVTFTSFTGKTSEMKFVKFFMKKVVQLKSLLVHPRSAMSEKERCVITEELSTYPKASTCLKLTVEEVEREKPNVAN